MKTPEDEAFDELARKQGAWGGGYQAKRKAAADKVREPWNEEQWNKNNWRCGHGWLRGEQCEICNAPLPAQEPVECLDCGSHNIGVPANYDSLVDSVKAQPAQEPVACERCEQLEEQVYDVLGQLKVANLKWSVAHPWVGLTDDEVMEMMGYDKQYGYIPQYARNFVEAISAKLKEKNT